MELTHERSHLMAELSDWSRPMSWAEILGQAHLNTQLEKALPWPWDEGRPVSPVERAEAQADLDARSAF